MASYRYAIKWIALNDDITDINHLGTPSMALVADLFNKTDEQVLEDVKKAEAKLNLERK